MTRASVWSAQLIFLSKGPPRRWPFLRVRGVIHVPTVHLIDEETAVYFTGRPASTIRRWAAENRITRHPAPAGRRNGVRYDVMELPAAVRDDTGTVTTPGEAPPVKQPQPAAA